MKKFLFLFILASIFISPFYSEDNQEIHKQEKFPYFSDYIVATGELFYINGTVALAEEAIDNTNFALFKPEEIKKTFNSGFGWDNSNYIKNQAAHPYFGTFYFNAARSNNISFLPSLFYTAAGSFIWETLIETGTISINDLITTTFSGAIAGEVFYRLGCEAFGFFKPLTWLINPFGSLNNFIRNQSFTATNNLSNFELLCGSGINSVIFDFPASDFKPVSNDFIPSFYAGFNLTYSIPYGHKSKEFLDQFSLIFKSYLNQNNKLFNFNMLGNLYSFPLYLSDYATGTAGLSYNYDFLHSDNLFYSDNSSGLLFNILFTIKNDFNISFMTQLNYSFLSTTDNYYLIKNDSKVSFNKKTSDYTYNHGPELLTGFSIENSLTGNFTLFNKALLLFPWKNSASDSQKYGIFFIDNLDICYEHKIVKNLFLGIEDNLIIKLSDFYTCTDVNTILNYCNLYLKYEFK